MAACLNSVESFISIVGKELGVSDWITVDQTMIDKFADASLDHQWIHVDSEKAAKESPYHKTIAHGYLTLSLLPYFLDQIVHVDNLDKIVNYGIEKMVFKSIVPVDSRLRMIAHLKRATDLGNICLATIQCIFEVEGQQEPVLEGNIKYLYYIKNNTDKNI